MFSNLIASPLTSALSGLSPTSLAAMGTFALWGVVAGISLYRHFRKDPDSISLCNSPVLTVYAYNTREGVDLLAIANTDLLHLYQDRSWFNPSYEDLPHDADRALKIATYRSIDRLKRKKGKAGISDQTISFSEESDHERSELLLRDYLADDIRLPLGLKVHREAIRVEGCTSEDAARQAWEAESLHLVAEFNARLRGNVIT